MKFKATLLMKTLKTAKLKTAKLKTATLKTALPHLKWDREYIKLTILKTSAPIRLRENPNYLLR